MGEATVFSLQGAALRVVVIEPAGAGFQGTGGNWLPLGIRPGGLPVPPVSYVHPASFHSEDLVVVLEQCLKASTLLLQELQGFLLQQPGDLAHREAASLIPVTGGPVITSQS